MEVKIFKFIRLSPSSTIMKTLQKGFSPNIFWKTNKM